MKVKMAGETHEMRAVWFADGRLKLIDQRRLPAALEITETDDWRHATEMIREMAVRGAPAIGITAAYAMAMALRAGEDLTVAAKYVKSARPTAYDLFYAVDRIANAFACGEDALRAADCYAEEIIGKCLASADAFQTHIRKTDVLRHAQCASAPVPYPSHQSPTHQHCSES